MSYRRIASIFCMVLVCAGGGVSATGQTTQAQGRSFHQSSSSEAWKASDEVTMSGVIQQAMTQHPQGAPAGFNFVMAASEKPLTVNAGTNLDEKVRGQLVSGASVEVIGLMRTMNGRNYLLARELVVGGQTVQIRSKIGFPVHAMASRGQANVRAKQVENNLQGGAR